jgi:hypothetical protein
MPRSLLVLVLLWLAACDTAPAADPIVRAIRFRQLISEGTMDLIHGGGMWHDCLYLPDEGIVCQVVWRDENRPGGGLPWREFPRAYAYRSRIDDRLARDARAPLDGQRAPEEIRIPAAVASEIVALADLADRERDMGERLGAQCVADVIVGGRESVQGRHSPLGELFR